MANENLPQQLLTLAGGGLVALIADRIRRSWARPDQQYARLEIELARKTAESDKNEELVAKLREALFELQKSHIPQKTENALLRTNRKNAAKILEKALALPKEKDAESLRLTQQALSLLRESIVVSSD